MAWAKVERAEKKVEPFSVDFAYTGTVQEYVVPATGLYKLEVWGGKGAVTQGVDGGYGGYSIGYKVLRKNNKLYIACGGAGNGSTGKGGFNGGGDAYGSYGKAAGGGASHIAFVPNTLASIGKDIFDKQGLLVAGGGGGSRVYTGGSGGGLSGGNGQSYSQTNGGGTQTKGYAFGQAENLSSPGGDCVAGGGGYYSGYGEKTNTAAGGGSGWIGGVSSITYKDTVYSPSTSNGVNSGNGKAKISYLGK